MQARMLMRFMIDLHLFGAEFLPAPLFVNASQDLAVAAAQLSFNAP
jgi:hypothetical protein